MKLPHEKLAFRYFKNLYEKNPQTTDAFHLLNETEIRTIQKIKIRSLLYAALFGTLGVVFLFVPFYILGNLIFWSYTLYLPWIGKVEFPFIFTIYGIVLAVIEIGALWTLNLRTVNQISEVCGFPSTEDKHYVRHIRLLFEVSMEKESTQMLAYKINPLEGLGKFQILLFTAFNLLKASISNLLVKVILGKVLGRFILRYVFLHYLIDLISIPIFAFWNIYATSRVIREAKIRIMAQPLIHSIAQKLYDEFAKDELFRNTLLDSLQYIALAKRKFHHNHFLLVEAIAQKFQLNTSRQTPLQEQSLFEKIKSLHPTAQNGLIQLIVFGILIDGALSRRELNLFSRLQTIGLLHIDFEKLKKWETSFIEGKGLNDFFDYQFV